MSARGFTVEKRCGARSLSTVSGPKRAGGIALPDAVQSALASIAADLRHLPNDCIFDRAELIHWLNRLARRIDGVAAMTTPAVRDPRTTARPRHRHTDLGRTLSAREVADAVFGKSAAAGRSPTCTIVTRKGRSVRVETRRGANQLSMEF